MSAIASAALQASAGGRFRFTRRQLYYELLRAAEAEPPNSPAVDDPAYATFLSRLERYEGDKGALDGLLRPEAVARVAADLPADLFDYAVRRVLVFDDVGQLLAFVNNRFHQRIEVAMVTVSGFPAHVWTRLDAQLREGIGTAFYPVHDCSLEGYTLTRRTRERLANMSKARIASVGMRIGQAFRLGIVPRTPSASAPVRENETPQTDLALDGVDLEERLALASGVFAQLEELRPHELMQFVYGRIARRSDDAGFG